MFASPVGITARRSMPDVPGDCYLICLLGSFQVVHQGQPLDILIPGKGLILLSAVALHLESGVPRNVLLDLLWPEQDVAHAAVSLNSLVYSLQRRLRFSQQEASAVIYTRGAYYLNQAAGYTTDIALFDACLTRADHLSAHGDETAARAVYLQGAALYRGDLYVGSDIHSVIERERLRTRYLGVLSWLAHDAFQRGDYPGTLQYAHRLLAVDPCSEATHRLVMRARVRQGERAQALRQYRLCQEALRREFDAAPEPLTTALFEQIRLDPGSV